MAKELKIAKKRLIKVTDKAYVFITSGYGLGEMFTIAISNIITTHEDSIKINDVHKEKALYFKINNKAFGYIEDSLGRMSEFDKEIL